MGEALRDFLARPRLNLGRNVLRPEDLARLSPSGLPLVDVFYMLPDGSWVVWRKTGEVASWRREDV